MDDTTIDTAIVCHARTPLVFDSVEERVARVQQLETTDLVDDVDTRSWPDSVRLADDAYREVVEAFDRYEAWADRRGVSVRPPFEIRTRRSVVEDDGVEVLVTPVVCLAIYRDGRLASVFPHGNGETTYTVDDALERLERGALPRPLNTGPDVPEGLACPECETQLVNGQGVFGCPECDWRRTVSAAGWSDVDDAGPGDASPAFDVADGVDATETADATETTDTTPDTTNANADRASSSGD